MGSEETNYFSLLGIDPDVENWSVIEKAIEQRRADWSRDLSQGSPQRRREAERCLKLLPDITESLRDPNRRRNIATQAKETATKANQENLDRFRAHMDEIRARGRHVDEDTLERLATDFKGTMSRTEIVAALRGHGVTVGDGGAGIPARQWPEVEPSKMTEIADLLTSVGHPTLYAFLDLPSSADIADIQDTVSARYREVHRDTAGKPAVNALLGHCMDIFRNAEGKKKYDNALYFADMSTLTGQLDAKGIDGILEEVELREILSTALNLHVPPEFAAYFVEDYAQKSGWTLTTDPALVIQKLSTGETTAASSDRTGAPNTVQSPAHGLDYSAPLILAVKNDQPISVPSRVVNDRLVFDLHHQLRVVVQSGFAEDWSGLTSIEDAIARGSDIFIDSIFPGTQNVKDAVTKLGLPISAAGLDPDPALIKKANSLLQSISTTLDDLAQREAAAKVVRQINRATRYRPLDRDLRAVFSAGRAVGGILGGVGRAAKSSRDRKKISGEVGEQVEEIVGEIMSGMVREIIARLQQQDIEIDQLEVAQARWSHVESNLERILNDTNESTTPASLVHSTKAILANYFYDNAKGLQTLFITVLQLEDWEAELERCAPIFLSCRFDMVHLGESENLQRATRSKLQALFESQIATQQLSVSAQALKSHLTLGRPALPYDLRASTASGDDGSWERCCLFAVSRSLTSADAFQINSVSDLRSSLERAEYGLQIAPIDVIKCLDSSGRISLVRRLIGGLRVTRLQEIDAAYIAGDLQLDERKLLAAEGANALGAAMSEATVADVVELTTKLQTWCRALGEDVWPQLAGQVDAKVLRSFCFEHLKMICDRNALEGLRSLNLLMTSICGDGEGSKVRRNAFVKTLDAVLDRSQVIPTSFLAGARRDFSIDDVDEIWIARAARKLAADVEREQFDLSSLNSTAEQLFAGDVPSSFYAILRGRLAKRMVPSIDRLDSLAELLEQLYRATGGDTAEVTDESSAIARSIERSIASLVQCNVVGRIGKRSNRYLGTIVRTLREIGRPVMIDSVFCWTPFGDEGNGGIVVSAAGVEVFDEKQRKVQTISHEMMATASFVHKGWLNQGFVFRGQTKGGESWESNKLPLSSKEVAETLVEVSRALFEAGISKGEPWLSAFHAAQVMRGWEHVVKLGGTARVSQRVLEGLFVAPGRQAAPREGETPGEEKEVEGRGWGGILEEILVDACDAYSDKGVLSGQFSGEREGNAREYICKDVGSSEKMYLIVDLTMMGNSNKKGIVVAESGIYWTSSKSEKTFLPWKMFNQCSLTRDGDKIFFGGGNEVDVTFGDVSAKRLHEFLLGLQGRLSDVVTVAGDDVLEREFAGRGSGEREAGGTSQPETSTTGGTTTSGDRASVAGEMPRLEISAAGGTTASGDRASGEGGEASRRKGSRSGDFLLLCLVALAGSIGWLEGVGAGLLVASLLGGFFGLVSVVYPIKAMRIGSRKQALAILLLSAGLFVTAGALLA